jgi:hypothetical protein
MLKRFLASVDIAASFFAYNLYLGSLRNFETNDINSQSKSEFMSSIYGRVIGGNHSWRCLVVTCEYFINPSYYRGVAGIETKVR